MGPEAAKLLAPHSINLDPKGGIPDLTPQDVAHALGTLKHRYASLVLRVKYAGQDEFKQDLFIGLYTNMMETGAKDWIRPRHHWVFDLCRTGLGEFLAPTLCPTCNGLGSFKCGPLTVTCEPCLGTGRYKQPDPAEIMGVKDWRRWDGQYRQVLGKLGLWEDIAIGALNRLDND